VIETWFGIVSFMLIVYVVLDGRNFGAGMLHWLVAKTPDERRQVVAAIGPLWSWHEVWLVGFGGTLMAVFPRLMASAFAGYYLALFLILWCLLLRGIALEVGGHINDRLWQGFWDFVFVVSSFLVAVLFGAAAGNLARGVPLDAQGNFSMAFFTNFKVRGYVGRRLSFFHEALAAAKAIRNNDSRLGVLAAVVGCVPYTLKLEPLLALIDEVASASRPTSLLVVNEGSRPTYELGGQPALLELRRAINDVCNWYP
jgi:cytochrome bd-type quinol oxidase subunit 2